MPSLGHTGGRYKPVSETATCPFVERQIGRNDIPEDMRDIFEQVISYIDALTPHVAGKHGIPSEADLADIELAEQALAADGITVNASKLPRFVIDNTRD